MSIRLQSGEKLVRRLRPHPLVFWHIYLAWIYFLLIGALFFLDENAVIALPLNSYDTLDLIWWEAVLLPAGVFAVLKRSWLLLFSLSFPGLSAFILSAWMGAADQNQLLMVFGISGTFAAEIYRRRRRYYITSRRLIIESGYLGISRRTLLYKRIDDVTIKQTLLGRIFSFGSIIPIIESRPFSRNKFGNISFQFEAGLAANSSGDGVNYLGDFKEQNNSRFRSDLQMDGVSNPDEIQELILSKMYEEK